MIMMFDYEFRPLVDAFPAFLLFPETVAECVVTAIGCKLEEGVDPRVLFDYLKTEEGVILMADIVFDGFDPGRESG